MVDKSDVGINEKGFLVDCFRKELVNIKYSQDAPKTLKTIIEKDAWKEFKLDNGVHGKHESFEAFVTCQPLEGLGSTIKHLRNICRDDPGALDALDGVTRRGKGGDNNPDGNNQHSKVVNGANFPIDQKPKSKPRDRTGKKLRTLKNKSPEIYQQYLDKELNLHQACLKAGVSKKQISISTKDPKSAAKAILKNTDAEFRKLLKELI